MSEPEKSQHRENGIALFNETWKLLKSSSRSSEDNVRMIHTAHASRLHWEFAGGPEQWAIGEWQVSRVYATLGHSEAAVRHAKLAVGHTEENKLPAWLMASCYEGLARALRPIDLPASNAALTVARHHLAEVKDIEDLEILKGDFMDHDGWSTG